VALTLAVVIVAGSLLAGSADGKRGKRHSGIDGTVVNSSCPGPCVYPPPPSPAYTGSGLTVTLRRVSNGDLIATLHPLDGHFRVRVGRGLYDVSAAVDAQPQPTPQPGPVIQSRVVMPPNCWQGDTQRVQVRRHHFTRVQLRVSNACVV
jgi:hypothetical protein